ncbi:MAG: hypothetical protein JNM68_01450, partial [Dinghuibacter sp.]|nr:hypothetical protein [Dinghuibacter sp.]
MSRQNKHIISRLRWNTVFNSKEQANELQNRLSNWSRQVFEREIPYLLNQFCAEGKLWTIHQLELDLGEIDYDELETSLLKKLKQQLYEALYRLTVNNPTSGENTIQVMDEQVSGIRMLSGFLLHGVIPWQYAAGVKDINQVMHDELAQHADAVMNMLHEIATNRREVRRRMAWQVSEPNIVTIIQQLEPANSNVIVEFANNLALVQEKETVVQAASGEFKKNVWFWVLNYLFTLHGSLFNKKEFLKSSIRQMAAHYNTGYEELLLLIRKLVMELSGSAKFSGFLEVLNILVNEQALRQNYHATTPVGEPTATGEQLKRYFLQQLVAGTIHNRDQWNRDVQRAAQQPWFGEWVQQLQPGTAGWQPLYRLSATSLEALFRVYPSPGSSIMLQQVQFFVAASVAAWLPVTKKELLIALLGEIKKQGLPGDNARTIMETLVRCVAGITRKPVQHIPALLLEAEIPAHEKTPVVVYWRKRMEIYYHPVSPQANHTVTQLYRVLRLWIT